MTCTVLFCVAEEAKPFIRKAFTTAEILGSPQRSKFSLAESKTPPNKREDFKYDLDGGADFQTDWIGASVEECQDWLWDISHKVNFIDHEMLLIADERTARDETLQCMIYNNGIIEFQHDGVKYPTNPKTWHAYRIHHKAAYAMNVNLFFFEPPEVYELYYHRKEELTTEEGVFNVARCQTILGGDLEAGPDLQP